MIGANRADSQLYRFPVPLQPGGAYEVMATLWLPSLWSNADVDSLQVGLARALAAHFGVGLESVHVITQIIEPGLVVEDGETLSR